MAGSGLRQEHREFQGELEFSDDDPNEQQNTCLCINAANVGEGNGCVSISK